MDEKQVAEKISEIREALNVLSAFPDLDPCINCGLEAAATHLELLYMELALDVL